MTASPARTACWTGAAPRQRRQQREVQVDPAVRRDVEHRAAGSSAPYATTGQQSGASSVEPRRRSPGRAGAAGLQHLDARVRPPAAATGLGTSRLPRPLGGVRPGERPPTTSWPDADERRPETGRRPRGFRRRRCAPGQLSRRRTADRAQQTCRSTRTRSAPVAPCGPLRIGDQRCLRPGDQPSAAGAGTAASAARTRRPSLAGAAPGHGDRSAPRAGEPAPGATASSSSGGAALDGDQLAPPAGTASRRARPARARRSRPGPAAPAPAAPGAGSPTASPCRRRPPAGPARPRPASAAAPPPRPAGRPGAAAGRCPAGRRPRSRPRARLGPGRREHERRRPAPRPRPGARRLDCTHPGLRERPPELLGRPRRRRPPERARGGRRSSGTASRRGGPHQPAHRRAAAARPAASGGPAAEPAARRFPAPAGRPAPAR